MYRLGLAICVGLVSVWNLGCSPSSPTGAAQLAQVTGTISIDGQPIPTGEIHFTAMGVPPAVLTITDGKYAGEAPVGTVMVEVVIWGDAGPDPMNPQERLTVNTVPERYWGPHTTLSASVTADGPNEFNFDIKS